MPLIKTVWQIHPAQCWGMSRESLATAGVTGPGNGFDVMMLVLKAKGVCTQGQSSRREKENVFRWSHSCWLSRPAAFAWNQMENRLCPSHSGAFNISPALVSWWTFWMSIYNLCMGVVLELFQPQAEFRNLWPPHGSLWHLSQDVNEPQFPQDWTPSLLQLPANTSSCSQLCWTILPWLWTKDLGFVKTTTSSTRSYWTSWEVRG